MKYETSLKFIKYSAAGEKVFKVEWFEAGLKMYDIQKVITFFLFDSGWVIEYMFYIHVWSFTASNYFEVGKLLAS